MSTKALLSFTKRPTLANIFEVTKMVNNDPGLLPVFAKETRFNRIIIDNIITFDTQKHTEEQFNLYLISLQLLATSSQSTEYWTCINETMEKSKLVSLFSLACNNYIAYISELTLKFTSLPAEERNHKTFLKLFTNKSFTLNMAILVNGTILPCIAKLIVESVITKKIMNKLFSCFSVVRYCGTEIENLLLNLSQDSLFALNHNVVNWITSNISPDIMSLKNNYITGSKNDGEAEGRLHHADFIIQIYRNILIATIKRENVDPEKIKALGPDYGIDQEKFDKVVSPSMVSFMATHLETPYVWLKIKTGDGEKFDITDPGIRDNEFGKMPVYFRKLEGNVERRVDDMEVFLSERYADNQLKLADIFILISVWNCGRKLINGCGIYPIVRESHKFFNYEIKAKLIQRQKELHPRTENDGALNKVNNSLEDEDDFIEPEYIQKFITVAERLVAEDDDKPAVVLQAEDVFVEETGDCHYDTEDVPDPDDVD